MQGKRKSQDGYRSEKNEQQIFKSNTRLTKQKEVKPITNTNQHCENWREKYGSVVEDI